MVAAEFIGYINSFSATHYVGVEDLADRANFQWNVIVLLLCMTMVTLRQYFMAPLVCYLPTTFSGASAESYVTNLCWVEGTLPVNLTSGVLPARDPEKWDDRNPDMMSEAFFVPASWMFPCRGHSPEEVVVSAAAASNSLGTQLRPSFEELFQRRIGRNLASQNYYQWVPLVLGLQAVLYYIPRIVWSIFTFNRTGTDLQNLINTASSGSKEEGEKRDKIVNHMVKTLELMLFSRRHYRGQTNNGIHRAASHLPGKRHGNNLIYYYILIKLLYIAIGLLQIYIMYAFLRFDKKEGYFFFGIRILNDIRSGKPWTETQVFPRVGVCRQPLQNVGATNHLFAQCVLPINMLNEKIYVFLYFFLASVMFFTIFSIPLWLLRIAPRRQAHFVKRFLKMADCYKTGDAEQKALVNRFVSEFLRQDGHFLLRMLSMNAGDLITVEIVCSLFGVYQKDYCGKDFRGYREAVNKKANEYGDPQRVPLAGTTAPPYQIESEKEFMSAKLQPGGMASSTQRPLPSAPLRESTPYPRGDFEDPPKGLYPPAYPDFERFPVKSGNDEVTPIPSDGKTRSEAAPPSVHSTASSKKTAVHADFRTSNV